MSVRILRARLHQLDDHGSGNDRCTFVWEDTDEESGNAVQDLVRNGWVIEEPDGLLPRSRRANCMPAPATLQ